jgi:hypothetical protein
MERPVVRRLIALVTSLPAALLGVMTAGMLLRALVGPHPLWRAEPLNLSEAAAVRDPATVARLMKHGEDPYLRRDVRADLLFNDRRELTPLESAIASRRADVVEVILTSAPPPEPSEWSRLRCLAMLEDDDELGEALDRFKPATAVVDCTSVTRPWK